MLYCKVENNVLLKLPKHDFYLFHYIILYCHIKLNETLLNLGNYLYSLCIYHLIILIFLVYLQH